MLLALLPGLVLAMWGLSALFEAVDPDPEEDDDALPVADAPGTIDLTDQSDTFAGTWGADTINAGPGDDVVYGDTSYPQESPPDFPFDPDDVVNLGAGNDSYGDDDGDDNGYNRGNDLVRGGAGDDLLEVSDYGGSTVYGDLGDDVIEIRDADPNSGLRDTAYGGDGDDLIYSDLGDTVSGGAGQDSFFVRDGYCSFGVATTITDYQPGETITAFVTWHPTPGLQTVTTVPSEDGQSQILTSETFSIVLQGITEPIDVEVLVQAEYDFDPDFFCD